MSEKEKVIQNNQNKEENLEIIEETIGATNIPFSEVFQLYTERILDGGEDKLFKGDDLINLNIDEKNKFEIKDSINRDLIYDGEIIYFPIVVSFEKDDINKIYKMFTKKYFDKIYKEMKFTNPMLSIGNSIEKYENNTIDLFTEYNEGDNIYKIFEKKDENYAQFYSTKIKALKQCSPLDLTPNFKYYFTSPNKDCQMQFSFNSFRKKAIAPIFNFKKKKINPIFGPYGSGKTTTLILEARNYDNTCYLNLNALNQYKDDLHIWKYDLFLKEFYNIFKKEEEKKKEEIKAEIGKEEKTGFQKIKEQILQSNHFWEAISLSIKFCIENKIDSIFILDQYKEEIDPQFSQFKEIKKLINDEKNIYVKLVVASSTNNLDIRDFIIKKYVQKLSKNNLVNDYIYIQSLFKLTDIKGLIDILPESKKTILEEYFSNIPSYFYIIYDSGTEDINQTISKIKKIITEDIENFYKINSLTRENLCFIIKNFPKIGDTLSKKKEGETEIIEPDIIERFIKILPIKYFTFDIKDGAIVKIYFYFKLAKICFLEFIFKQIYEYFEQPKIDIPERTIGDILEIIVIENLKNNSSENIEQIVKVDSIWEMKTVEGLDKSKVKENNILIIQTNEFGKKVDFGLLFKGETLVLIQCKKALSEKPKDYIKISDIFNNKKYLYETIQNKLGCDIKKIKLLYLTGIYFIDKEKTKFHSWSKNDTSYNALEEITCEDNIPLIFFDVQEKQFMIKKNINDNINFEQCKIIDSSSLIYDEDIYTFVEIESDKKEVVQIIEGLKNHFEKKMLEFTQNSKIEERSENDTSISIYEEYFEEKNIGKKIIPKKRVTVTNPDTSLLSNIDENVLTTFKIKSKQYFCYYDDKDKKMKYVKVERGTTKDFEFKDLKIYLLQKKTERNQSKKQK